MEVSISADVDHALTIAAVVGEIDIANAERLGRELFEAAPQDGAYVVDLSGVTYLDSAGIGELFALATSRRATGARLALIVPGGSPLNRLLKITQFEQAAPVFATRDLAADVLGAPPPPPGPT